MCLQWMSGSACLRARIPATAPSEKALRDASPWSTHVHHVVNSSGTASEYKQKMAWSKNRYPFYPWFITSLQLGLDPGRLNTADAVFVEHIAIRAMTQDKCDPSPSMADDAWFDNYEWWCLIKKKTKATKVKKTALLANIWCVVCMWLFNSSMAADLLMRLFFA